ncbi:MAG TPA: serine hydrolase domain-containing protein, partial [Longimicrobiales bacterium]|nr:serine hydrolase domain-containing protein [Longimicrobiales bacterium]
AKAGMSWDDFVAQRLFQPLGMRATSTRLAIAKAAPNVATPHQKRGAEIVTVEWRGFERVAGAGAMNSNVEDLARWLRFHLAGGRAAGKPLLGEAALRETYRPQNILSANYQAMFNPDALLNAYGFGWVISQYRGKTLLEHGGAVDVFTAIIAMVPEAQIGLVMTSNLNINAAIVSLRDLKFVILNELIH